MIDGPAAYVVAVRRSISSMRWMGGRLAATFLPRRATDGLLDSSDERASRGASVPLHRHPEDMESVYVLEAQPRSSAPSMMAAGLRRPEPRTGPRTCRGRRAAPPSLRRRSSRVHSL